MSKDLMEGGAFPYAFNLREMFPKPAAEVPRVLLSAGQWDDIRTLIRELVEVRDLLVLRDRGGAMIQAAAVGEALDAADRLRGLL